MELKDRLKCLKNKVIVEIERASKVGNTVRILQCSEVLRKIEESSSQINNLESLVNSMENILTVSLDTNESAQNIYPTSIILPTHRSEVKNVARAKARFARDKILKELQNRVVNLSKKGKSERVFTSNDGKIYGIAYASEYKTPRWFLGLPIQEYDVIIFICEKSNAEIYWFMMPKEFIDLYIEFFSFSGGEYKFNIFNVGSRWEISFNKIKRVKLKFHKQLI